MTLSECAIGMIVQETGHEENRVGHICGLALSVSGDVVLEISWAIPVGKTSISTVSYLYPEHIRRVT